MIIILTDVCWWRFQLLLPNLAPAIASVLFHEIFRTSVSVQDKLSQLGQDINYQYFRTVFLDSKDKKKTSLPKSQVVRKVHKGGAAGVSPSQSYSGLGPGRGPTRPQSPVKAPAPPPAPSCSSSLQSNQHKSYQPPKPAPKPPVNTEIMKKSLRLVSHIGPWPF